MIKKLIRKMQTAAGGPIDYKKWDNRKITSYTIPYIKEKVIKLTNAGKATGAKLSTNLLDSVADNAYRAKLPIRKALGIAFKESTFGNPTDDKSAWNLSSKIRKLFNNEYPGTYLHINNGHTVLGQHLINYHKGDINHEVFYEGNPDAHKSIILEAFEFYKQHPDKYNSGQKNYQLLIDKLGDEAMQSPEVLKWYEEWEKSKVQVFRPEPYKINTNIQNTAQEFVPRNKQGGKMNILEFLKNGSGIHIKKKNRGKFTSYCGGKVTSECIRKAKASGNPTLVKRATFAANARKWKHLEGGIINPNNEIEFYKNWLNSRKDKLYENMGNLGDVDSEIVRQLNNISEYTYENTNSDKFIGETDHKNKVVRLTPNALPTTLLHEIIHTAIRRDSPLILKLKQLLSLSLDGIIDYDYLNKKWKENPNSYAKDLKKTAHYEKLNEYIPRLYEFRMENNLDPNKEYKEEEIIPLMLKSNIPSIKEGYYNPKMFTKALNEVAYNSTSNKKLLAKKGNKAFVKGVNILDSNPKAYKYVKKAQQGGNINWGQLISGVASSALSTYALNQLIKALKELEVSELKGTFEEMKKLLVSDALEKLNQLRELWKLDYLNGTTLDRSFESNAVYLSLKNNLTNNATTEAKNKYENLKKGIDAKYKSLMTNNWMNFGTNLMLTGMGIAGLYLSNKGTTNAAPSTTPTTTPTTTGSSIYKLDSFWEKPYLTSNSTSIM